MNDPDAAPPHSSCDACGEPNRTGESVTYVSKDWCNTHQLDWHDDLKLCMWCRSTMTQGIPSSKERVRRQVARAKKWYDIKSRIRNKLPF